MKTVTKILKTVIVIFILVFTSCSAEDGIDGVDGLNGEPGIAGVDGQDGADGEDGQDGQDGEDGEDGNPNIQTFTFDMSTESGERAQFSSTAFTIDFIKNNAVLWYVDASGVTYQAPGIGPFGEFQIRTFIQPGFTGLIFHNFDGSSYSISEGRFSELRVIFIDITTGSSKFNSKDAILEELKNNGVDSSNYEETLAYLIKTQ